MKKKLLVFMYVYLLLVSVSSSFALTFNFNSAPGMSIDAINGFVEAGNIWSSYFNDSVTVNIDVSFNSLGAGILGSTNVTTMDSLYSDVRNSLFNDRTTTYDSMAFSSLQTGPNLSFLTTDMNGNNLTDNNNSVNNSHLNLNTANAKALGMLPSNNNPDAIIKFSSDFSFDFNSNDGITPGMYDFVGIAAHEIGHAMGFVSGVDTVDITSLPGGLYAPPVDLNNYRVFTTLDLFRYSGDGILDLAVGGTPYFSIDGGITNLAAFSTGRYNGDGRQASHWKDSLGLGLMDPTLALGELATVSAVDFQAIDVIGWDLNTVPEPATIFLVISGLAGMIFIRRRQNLSA